MRKCNGGFEIDKENSTITVFLSNALARCSAPAASMSFDERLSVVSV